MKIGEKNGVENGVKQTDGSSISARRYAEMFLKESKPKNVISDVLDFFSMNCFKVSQVDMSLLDELIEAFEQANGAARADILEKIVSLIQAADQESESEIAALSREIVEYIDERFCDDASLEEIARQIGVSYHYMCHLFRESTGETVNGYRNKKRILKAQRMLVETDKKITDIATECGFNSASYFTEKFVKFCGMSPSKFRTSRAQTVHFPYYGDNDAALAGMVPTIRLMNEAREVELKGEELYTVHMPDENYTFLHESAIISYHGILYASWFNCPRCELRGHTPIRGRRSADGGKTWSEVEVIAEDPTDETMYCPPVYGICEDRLYMLVNVMTKIPDHIHALECYVLENDRFKKLWRRPVPFKINTNVVTLPDGRLIVPGRCGKLDKLPDTPALLVSDSGRIDAEWRIVKIAPDGVLPDGEKYVNLETTTALAGDGRMYAFCRQDRRKVPIVYYSDDCGERWSELHAHDIPVINSKMHCGTLSDGRFYLIANIFNNKQYGKRSKLAMFVSKPGTVEIDHWFTLREGDEPGLENVEAWHYPSAYEVDGKLYIIYTVGFPGNRRGAVLSVIDIKNI